MREFQAQCADALTDRYTALFEEHRHHAFVDDMMAALEYDRFFERMTRSRGAK